MKSDKKLAFRLAVLAAILAPLVAVLPDTAIGSPRSALTAIIAGLLAGAAMLRGPS